MLPFETTGSLPFEEEPKVEVNKQFDDAYKKYVSEYDTQYSKPQIPGNQVPKKLSREEWEKKRNSSSIDNTLGFLEAPASFIAKLPAQLAGGPATIYGAMRGMRGKELENIVGVVTRGPTWTDPRTERGQKLVQGAGEFLQPFGLSPYANIGQVGARGSMLGRKPKPVEAAKAVMPETASIEAVIKGPEAQPVVSKKLPFEKTNESQQMELFDQPEMGRVANPYEAKLGDWRVDENGIPIKADLSMELQNLQEPLQKNLWGDELPQTRNPIGQAADLFDGQRQMFDEGMQEGIPLTQAIDNMEPAARTEAIGSQLKGSLDASGELQGAVSEANSPFTGKFGQRGAIDLKAIQDTLEKIKIGAAKQSDLYAAFDGAFNPYIMKTAMEEAMDPKSRERLVWMSPDDFLKAALKRDEWYKKSEGANVRRDSVKEGLKFSKDGLREIPYLWTEDGTVRGHEGRHRADVFKEMGVPLMPVRMRDAMHRNEAGKYSEKNPTLLSENGEVIQTPKEIFDLPESSTPPKHKEFGGLNIKDATDWLTGKGHKGGAPSSTLPKIADLEINPEFKLEDTIETPRSVETIAAKNKAKTVSKITGVAKSVYDDVTTIEEAKADPGRDVTNSPARDYTISGLEGMVRTNPDNNLVRFGRYVTILARNAAEKFSKTYVTGDSGINQLYRQMSKDEWVAVAETLRIGSENKVRITAEHMQALGFNEKQSAFVTRLQEALDVMLKDANKGLESIGMKGLKEHTGYMPSMFSGAYTTLVGHYVTTDKGKKKFIVKGVAQGDTKAQHAAAVEWYKKQGDKFAETVELPYRGLRDNANRGSRVFDGFNDLINIIAENDVDFAETKALADAYAASKLKDLYNFDVHEKKKTGARGSLGDRPWKDRHENAKDFLEGIVNYLEEGSRYYNYLPALHEIGKLVRDEKLSVTHPNTLRYLERYAKHVTGQSINPIGAGSNWAISKGFGALGLSPQAASVNVNRMMSGSSAMMMGVVNLPFFFTQLMQPIISGLPEGLRVSGVTHKSMFDSLMSTAQAIALAGPDVYLGTSLSSGRVPPHFKNAMDYARDHGLMTFSEAELAHEVLQSKGERWVNNTIHWPSTLAEKLTRPPMFLMYADMFIKSGLPEDVAFRKAQYATDYAMVNYHPDERPMIYGTFGQMGRFMGALTTYKHNLGTGAVSTALEATPIRYNRKEGAYMPPKEHRKYAPAIAAVAAMGLFYGVSGIMGYEEADQIYKAATGESIKHAVLGDDLVESSVWHGMLSAKTGIDFQSRLSMASALPDTFVGAISPQASVLGDIIGKAYEAAKNQDEASFKQLALGLTPSGLKGFTEAKLLTDEGGYLLNKEGEHKFAEPRSPEEIKLRKIIGFKPLRERLESDDVYARSNQERKRSEKLANASSRFRTAVKLGDDSGAAKHLEDYRDNGGDLNTLLSNAALKKWFINSYQSERERKQGVPSNNVNQLEKYKAYQQ